MAIRKFSKKQRNTNSRREKPIMLIVSEGNNVTERQYFLSFQIQHGKYNIKFPKTGHVTDPVGLFKAVEKYWISNGLSEEKGDKAYIVLDLDCLKNKAEIINKLNKEKTKIKFIVSNPCIEVWFLLHFRYSTKMFSTGDEVKREMSNFISNYQENTEVATILRPNIKQAVENSERVQKHFASLGMAWISEECNPMTDVHEIIKELDLI